jgi:hypothetical protein
MPACIQARIERNPCQPQQAEAAVRSAGHRSSAIAPVLVGILMQPGFTNAISNFSVPAVPLPGKMKPLFCVHFVNLRH